MLRSSTRTLFRSTKQFGSWLRSFGRLEQPQPAASVRVPDPCSLDSSRGAEKPRCLQEGSICRYPACWLCDGSLEVYWSLAGAEGQANSTYHRCTRCGLLMVSPYLADPLLGISPEEHDNYVNDPEKYTACVSVEVFLLLLDQLERHWFGAGRTSRGRLLEVGSAAGYFLSGARARRWLAEGIEPASPVASWSQRYLQVPVHQGSYESTALPDATYDVVVAIEVFEHLLDPVSFLRWAHRKLAPGGMLFLTTPNAYSKAYYPPQPNTPILCPVDHLNLFSKKTLPRPLAQIGFRPIRLETDGPLEQQLQVFAFKSPGG